LFNAYLGYGLQKAFFDDDAIDPLYGEVKKWIDEKKPDEQCDLSPSFYGKDYEVLNTVHKNILPEVSKAFNKRLATTYVYGRMYKKGQVLERHSDRPACQYSISLTLNSSDDANSWPFYIQGKDGKESRIELNKGDAVFYEGELDHWRNTCEKDWQLQLFFHFVDLDGEYAEHAEDNISRGVAPAVEEVFYWAYEKDNEKIPSEICDYYLKEFKKKTLEKASIGSDTDNNNIDISIRNVKNAQLHTYTGIPAYLYAACVNANNQVWNFDISSFKQAEYSCLCLR